MPDVFFKEVFEFPINEFKKHLENDTNERIIFSGKFGSGKTSFLKQFFEDENQKSVFNRKKYEVYHLFPVNYSVSSNEDIMRYIKYDIIMEMLKGEKSFTETVLYVIDTLPAYVRSNALKIVAGIIYMIPKIGKDVIEAFERVDKLKDEYLKFHDDANKSESDKLIEYLDNLDVKEGSIYEDDVITRIITKNIGVEAGEKKYESILIVDDLDRLDPEHVFRILNVFAAHFDSYGYNDKGKQNKFNFDKIIIVCDLKNIRNIFFHKYGLETDFSGYIDKFFSSDIYQFDNRLAVRDIAKKIFVSLILKEDNGYNQKYIWDRYFEHDFVVKLTFLFIINSYISLRSLLRLYRKTIDYHIKSIRFNTISMNNSYDLPIAIQLKLIQDLFGDYEHMKNTLYKCLNQGETIQHFNSYFPALLFTYINFEKNIFTNYRQPVSYDNQNLIIEYNDNNRNLDSVRVFEPNSENPQNFNAANRDFFASNELCWKLMIDTAERLHKTGYL